MPDFEFTSPEGKTYTVSGPPGATKEEAFQMLQAQLGQQQEPSGPLKFNRGGPTGGDSTTKRTAAGVAMGIADLGNTALNALTYLPGKVSPAIAQWNRTRNADFEALTEQNKDSTAFKIGRVGGNIAVTLPVGGLAGQGIKAVAALPRLAPVAPQLARLATAASSGGMRTGASMAAGASRAARAGDMATRMAGGAITGGASTALVTPNDIERGALIGAVLPPALLGAGKAARYVGQGVKSFIQPFTDAGQEAIAANIIRRFGAGGPMEVEATELVPGSVPTLAEATGNAGLATLQRGARDIRPNAFVEREGLNAAARTAAFDEIAGDSAAIQAATAACDEAATTLYGRAFAADAMRQDLARSAQQARAPYTGAGLSAPVDDLATPGLRELATRPMFKQAVEEAKRLAANRGHTLADPLQSLEGLHYVKLALDDALNPTAKTAMGRNASNAVMYMRDKLADELAQISPLYGNARRSFAEMSQPVNEMEALQGLRLTDARGNITLPKVKNAIQSLERLRKVPGANNAKSVNADKLKKLEAIHDDLLRQDRLNLGRSAGSNTFQNIATDNILSSLAPGSLGVLAQGKIGGLLGQAGRLAYSGPNEAIRNRLADMMLDPQLAQAVLARQAIPGPTALERLLELPAAQQVVPRIASGAAADRP